MKKLTVPVYKAAGLAFLLLASGLFACQELSVDSQPSGPLKMQTDAQDEYTLPAAAPRDVVFSISSNTPWTIESDGSWCIPSPAMSAASSLVAEITVKTEANPLEEDRTAVLTLTAEGIEAVKTITIRQEAKGRLQVQPVDDMLERGGGEALFTVCSNRPWTVVSSNLWLTFDCSEGAGSDEVVPVHVRAASNNGAKRTATVTVKNGLEEKVFEVTQDGVVLEPEEPLAGAVALPAAGGSVVVKIRANTGWKAVAEAGWLVTKVNEKNELTVSAVANPLFGTRRGKVLLKPEQSVAGFDEYAIEFTQERHVQISGSETVNDDLSATLTGGSSTNRYATRSALKRGKITWEFSDFTVGTGGVWFDVNGWPDAGTANFHLWLYESSCELTSGGTGFGGWDGVYPGFTADEIRNIRQLAIEVTDDEVNPGKLKIVLYVNGEEKGCMRNRENAYADPSEQGQVVYFGYTDSQPGCSCTIRSVTLENYDD